MDEVEKFFEFHRAKLLSYLDGMARQTTDRTKALEYVDAVLDEWSEKFSGKDVPEPGLRERTFWFALYQLEELVEYPTQGGVNSYERILMEDLETVTELLRTGSALPSRYFATRPGESCEDAF